MQEGDRTIDVKVLPADVLCVHGDVLALEFPQGLLGLAKELYDRLTEEVGSAQPLPEGVSDCVFLKSPRGIDPDQLLFVGVGSLAGFEYERIRRFSYDVMVALSQSAPDTKHLLMTLQGVGYGLDPEESFNAEIAGLLDAVNEGTFPAALKRITIVEQDKATCTLVESMRKSILPDGVLAPGSEEQSAEEQQEIAERLETAGSPEFPKEHVFVVMPLLDPKKEKDPLHMEDTFKIAIERQVRAAGFLCERAQHTVFTGDVMEWVKSRIRSASLVVADVTLPNPNVYLEIGLAWGYGRPTLIITGDESTLRFNLLGQQHLEYSSICDLEEKLSEYIEAAKTRGVPGSGSS